MQAGRRADRRSLRGIASNKTTVFAAVHGVCVFGPHSPVSAVVPRLVPLMRWFGKGERPKLAALIACRDSMLNHQPVSLLGGLLVVGDQRTNACRRGVRARACGWISVVGCGKARRHAAQRPFLPLVLRASVMHAALRHTLASIRPCRHLPPLSLPQNACFHRLDRSACARPRGVHTAARQQMLRAGRRSRTRARCCHCGTQCVLRFSAPVGRAASELWTFEQRHKERAVTATRWSRRTAIC